ncbi:hypothetical protein M8J75_014044 [Diaphorina citri]|nr:hypothetical protein M8J75_014044 [Diaphorina citri]
MVHEEVEIEDQGRSSTMEKKRKLQPEVVENDSTIVKKKKTEHEQAVQEKVKENSTKSVKSQNEKTVNENQSKNIQSEENTPKKEKKKNKKEKSIKNDDKIENSQDRSDINESIAEAVASVNESEENTSKKDKKKKKQSITNDKCEDNKIDSEINENKDEANVSTNESISPSEPDGDGVNTPTTKKPPRKSGETKKQYKRRMRALREAGLLIDPPVVEGVKKDKRNRKSRKEKRMAKQKKNEELDKFRSIVQINYLKMWKNEPSKWKFNKNVQGKLLKHMFNSSRIPQDIFEILIEYIGTTKSIKLPEEVNKKCSQVVEAMEKWTSASEEEKKKLTEPDSSVYERARQVLQSLA